MKKLLVILIIIFNSNNSLALDEIILNCEGKIRQTDSSFVSENKIESFYEELKFQINTTNEVMWVTRENTSHAFMRPSVYVKKNPQKLELGSLKISNNNRSFTLSSKIKTKIYPASDSNFSKLTVDGIRSRFSLDSRKYEGKFFVTFYLKDGSRYRMTEFDFESNCSGADKLLTALNQRDDNFDIDDDEIIPASSGTGFVISKEGHMITNFHVVEGCSNVKALYNGSEHESEILAVDKVNDLAVIKASIKPKEIYKISETDGQLLEDVIVAGYPLGKKVSASIKATSGTITALSGLGNNYGEFQTDAALNSGNSGGPIIDEMGNVVGVAVSKIQEEGVESFNFGIKSSILRVFLNSNKINLLPSNKKEMKKKDLGKLITDATIYLDCLMTGKQIKKLIREKSNSQKAIYKNFN